MPTAIAAAISAREMIKHAEDNSPVLSVEVFTLDQFCKVSRPSSVQQLTGRMPMFIPNLLRKAIRAKTVSILSDFP
jgi:hypothetical protein